MQDFSNFSDFHWLPLSCGQVLAFSTVILCKKKHLNGEVRNSVAYVNNLSGDTGFKSISIGKVALPPNITPNGV